jgi:16S rRNA (cytosine967-C5)-methyltransferase
MGANNITALQKDSSVFDKAYEEQFDGVLCDVPCSGFGTVSENPDIKLFRKEEDFASLRKTQAEILSACSRYVKKGGALYYSTCSVFEEENDGIVEGFLRAHGEFTVCAIDSPLAHERKKYGLQFLPDTAYGAGFFVCKMVKK